jgi:hypothetical protein
MAFKIHPFYNIDNTPIYKATLEEGVLGKTNNNGTIVIDEKVGVEQQKEVEDHEFIHVDQIKRGDLSYDDDNVYWKNKTYPRSEMSEGAKNLPWEAEAYKNK